MSLKVTCAEHWRASYSTFHPENPNKPSYKLPEPIVAPPPLAPLTDHDRARGAGGHTLCSEMPYNACVDTGGVQRSPQALPHKVGQTGSTSTFAELGKVNSKSGFYGATYRNQSFAEMADLKYGRR